MANPNVGQRGQPVAASDGRTLGYVWRGTGAQLWCAEYQGPNGIDVDSLLGAATTADAARWLVERILGADGPPVNPASR